jgi:hypothetical protein
MTHTEIMLLILAAGLLIYFVWRKIRGSKHVRRMLFTGSKQNIEEPKVGSKRSCCG